MTSTSLAHIEPSNGILLLQHGRQEQVYEYEPLQSPQHIRLLRLAPGNEDAPSQCSLLQVDSSLDQSYEAISYAWGDAKDRESIICDGKYLAITRNLFEVFCSFRSPLEPRCLWADAICIDQQNVKERNAQVQLMASIYSKATKVLLWVGNETAEVTDIAFQFLDCVTAQTLKDLYRTHDWITPLSSWFSISAYLPSLHHQPQVDGLDAPIVMALTRLLSSPVFQRGWVIQEVALASSMDVCWGQSRIDLNRVYIALERLMRLQDLGASIEVIEARGGFVGLESMYSVRLQMQGERSTPYYFLELLELAQHCKFSDERDRVYGLLALQQLEKYPKFPHVFVRPDYSTGVLEAYKQVVEKCLIQDKRIDALLCVHHEKAIDDDWLSWVPRWKEWSWYYLNTKNMSTNEDPGITKSMRTDQECISIRGFRVDVVDTLEGGLSLPRSEKQVQTLLRRIWKKFDPVSVAYTATHGAKLERSSPFYLKRGTRPSTSQTLFQAKSCQAFLNLDLPNRPLPINDPTNMENDSSGVDMAYDFLGLCQHHLPNKKLFGTSHNTLGLGPPIVEKGDVLVVLFGKTTLHDDEWSTSVDSGQLLFLLRPVGDLWRLVGPSYVYDVMTGHAYEKWKKSGTPAEDFCIY